MERLWPSRAAVHCRAPASKGPRDPWDPPAPRPCARTCQRLHNLGVPGVGSEHQARPVVAIQFVQEGAAAAAGIFSTAGGGAAGQAITLLLRALLQLGRLRRRRRRLCALLCLLLLLLLLLLLGLRLRLLLLLPLAVSQQGLHRLQVILRGRSSESVTAAAGTMQRCMEKGVLVAQQELPCSCILALPALAATRPHAAFRGALWTASSFSQAGRQLLASPAPQPGGWRWHHRWSCTSRRPSAAAP